MALIVLVGCCCSASIARADAKVCGLAISPIPDLVLDRFDFSPSFVRFAIEGVKGAPEDLVLSAVSDNQAFVRDGDIAISRSGAERTLVIRSDSPKAGTSVITVTATDTDGCTASRNFKATVPGRPPSITAILDQTVAIGGTVGPIYFQLSDGSANPNELTVKGHSSNPGLVPMESITFVGTGASRNVSLRAAPGGLGSSEITLTVSDADGMNRQTRFKVVTPEANQPPSITMALGIPFANGLPTFIVSDRETAPESLQMTDITSDGEGMRFLLPYSKLSIRVAGATRTVSLQPGLGGPGIGHADLRVTDGQRAVTATRLHFQALPEGATIYFWQSPNGVLGPSIPTPTNNANRRTYYASPTNHYTVDRWYLDGIPVQTGGLEFSMSTQDSVHTLVATFKRTVPVAGDLDGDENPDIVFQDDAGHLAVWQMAGTNLKSARWLSPSHVGDARWRVVGSADFDGDVKTDLLFQRDDGRLAVWHMDGPTQVGIGLFDGRLLEDPGWRVVANAILAPPPSPALQLLFQHQNGMVGWWSTTLLQRQSFGLLIPSHPGDAGWRVVGSGYFDQDRETDLLFQHDDGALAVWHISGYLRLAMAEFVNPPHPCDRDWRVVAVADWNQDGRSDLLFQHGRDGSLAVWLMNGIQLNATQWLEPRQPGGTWKVVAP